MAAGGELTTIMEMTQRLGVSWSGFTTSSSGLRRETSEPSFTQLLRR
jgi:hypothetical protein